MKIRLMLGLVLWMGLTSCASLVSTDFDKSVDFSRYKTFAWMPPSVQTGKNPIYRSGLIHRNLQRTVEDEFAKRGIVRDDRHPDFLVGYHTYTEKKERTYGGNAYPYGYYPFYGRGWWGPYGTWGWQPYGGWYNAPQKQTYTEGTLIIDVVDSRTQQLVWRGAIEGDVDNVARLQKHIEKGVQAILKKYPAFMDNRPPVSEPV